MEEQKSKEIKMDVASNKELSYDDLKKVCADLKDQKDNYETYIKNLHRQMAEMNAMLQTKRLDYLFKVVEIANDSTGAFNFRVDFVTSCIEEIQESLTIPQDENTKAN